MAFAGAARAALAMVFFGLSGCAETPEHVEAPAAPAAQGEPSREAFDVEHWGVYHSKRFSLSVSLPEPKQWALDDHSKPELVARHAGTRSSVEVYTSIEPALVNRQRCEERARNLGFVPKGNLATVEDATTIGPGAYDTRVWVALLPGATDRDPITGHVFAFGGYVRKCLFFHYATEVPSARDESILSSRLALMRTRVLGALALDDFDNPPRQNRPK